MTQLKLYNIYYLYNIVHKYIIKIFLLDMHTIVYVHYSNN